MRSRTDGVSTGGARAEELAAAGTTEMEELAAARREEGGCAGQGAGGGGDHSGRRGGRRLGGEVPATGVGGSGVGEILLESPRVCIFCCQNMNYSHVNNK